MFTSRAFAPPRTCSSATSTAPAKSPDSTRRRKRAEPVTFVRSPIRTKPVSGPSSNGSSPLQRGRGTRGGGTRGASPPTAAAIAAVCSGPDPQQLPATLSRPARANSASRPLVIAGVSSKPPNAFGRPGVRMGADEAGGDAGEVGDVGAQLVRAEAAVDADDQRLGVLDARPERLDRLARERPPRAVDDRRRDPERQLGHLLARGDDRRLRVQGVEDGLEQEQVDAALGERAHLLGVGVLDLVEGVRPEAGVVDLRAEREGDVERPDRAGDEAVAGRLAGDPRPGEVHLVDERLERVVGLADRGRRERVRRRDVGAGGEVALVGGGDDVGPGQVEQVRVAGDVDRVVREALAAVVGGLQVGAVDQRPPGAVEHEDPLPGDPADLCPYVASAHRRTSSRFRCLPEEGDGRRGARSGSLGGC